MTTTNQANEGNALIVTKEQMKDPDFRSRPVKDLDLTAVSTPKENEGKDNDSSAKSQDSNKDVNDKGDGKRKSGIEKKFSKLTSERDSEREQKELLLARLADLEKRVTPAEKKVEQKSSSVYNVPKPKLDDKGADGKDLYDSIADHAEAVANWTFDKRETEKTAKTASDSVRTTNDKLFNDFFEAGSALEKEQNLDEGEWDAVVKDKDNRLSPAAAFALAELENGLGAKIAYDIFSDEKTKEKFESLSERQQVVFIGKLEAKAEAAAAASKSTGGNSSNKVSKAKDPSPSFKGSNAALKFDRTKSVSDLAAGFSSQIKSQADYRRLKADSR